MLTRGRGHRRYIEVEVWEMPDGTFCRFVAAVARAALIGSIKLA